MINFKGRHFPSAVILMAVRWYTAYSLSYRNVEEMMLERGTHVDHATLNRWVVEFSPKLEAVFCRRYKRKVHSSWRMDETYIKVKGKWCYYYRAVDKYGKTLDFGLSETRNRHDALAFFEKTIGQQVNMVYLKRSLSIKVEPMLLRLSGSISSWHYWLYSSIGPRDRPPGGIKSSCAKPNISTI